MTEIVLFHHAQGLTPGIDAFADELRRAGHTVHTPDLYDGHTFDTLEEGLGTPSGSASSRSPSRRSGRRKNCPPRWSTRAFRSEWGRPSGWRKRAKELAARF